MDDEEETELSDSNGKELDDLLIEHKLPFFAFLKNNESTKKFQELYLYEIFEDDCIFAKCYSSSLSVINYLLHHRPSFVPSESNLSSLVNSETQQNSEFMFSDIVNIPYNYNGLFELFSSNSTKAGGILDHERNLISLGDRLKKPKNYYVAKEMKVYEIVTDKSISLISLHKSMSSLNSNRFLYRKWTKFNQGTICRAFRVVVVDYNDGCDQVDNSYWSLFKNAACCKFNNKKKSDIAIEFKIIENFDELAKYNEIEDNDHTLNRKVSNNLKNIYNNKKSYYLPLNESNLNNDIDLIPISNSEKHLSFNNLQTINNLIKDEILIDSCLELKLYDENPFIKNINSSKSSKIQNRHFDNTKFNKNDHYVKLNQHLDLDKYLSIFELTEFKRKARILIGFALNSQELFFLPVDNLKLNFTLNKNIFIKMNDFGEKNSKLVKNFKLNNLETFKKIAKFEKENFRYNFNKIEIFSTIKNSTITTKQKLPIKPTINNFSDLVNIETSPDLEKINSSFFNKNLEIDNNHVHMQKQNQYIPANEIINVKNLIDSNNDNLLHKNLSMIQNNKTQIELKHFNEKKSEVFSLSKRCRLYDFNIDERANTQPKRLFDYKNEDFEDESYIIKL